MQHWAVRVGVRVRSGVKRARMKGRVRFGLTLLIKLIQTVQSKAGTKVCVQNVAVAIAGVVARRRQSML